MCHNRQGDFQTVISRQQNKITRKKLHRIIDLFIYKQQESILFPWESQFLVVIQEVFSSLIHHFRKHCWKVPFLVKYLQNIFNRKNIQLQFFVYFYLYSINFQHKQKKFTCTRSVLSYGTFKSSFKTWHLLTLGHLARRTTQACIVGINT